MDKIPLSKFTDLLQKYLDILPPYSGPHDALSPDALIAEPKLWLKVLSKGGLMVELGRGMLERIVEELTEYQFRQLQLADANKFMVEQGKKIDEQVGIIGELKSEIERLKARKRKGKW